VSVRVGIVSFAHVHSPAYAAVLRDLQEADFLGIADEVRDRGSEAADRFGVRYFESTGSLLGEVDAVVVCSENKNHARDVIPALEGGVHVLCEKPIATTIEDAEAMIGASESSGSQLRIAFPIRYLPSVVRARELVRGGSLGRVLAVNGTNHGQIPGGWFLDPELAGGGAVMDHTVHLADILRWMLDVEVKSVYAEVDSFFGGGETDDAAILTLQLEGGPIADGTIATIDPSWSRGDGYPTWGDVTLRIAGTSGVLDVDPFARPLRTFDHESSAPSWSYTGQDMNELMLADFLRGVAEGKPAGASGLDGLRTLEIVLAAYRAGEDHEPKMVERTPPRNASSSNPRRSG
jgi:predicted dehydrogenase